MKRIALALAASTLALGLAAGPALAQTQPQAKERPLPRETTIISTMNDVMYLMRPQARDQVNGLLAKARAALKAGNDAEYEASIEGAMMIVAKEIMSEAHERGGG